MDFDKREGVMVNDRLQTANPRIYAAGDVCMKWKFTHAADAAARMVIQNALFKGRKKLSSLTMPWCTYTDPEIAHVGMYESDAADKGVGLDTFTRRMNEVDRAMADGEEILQLNITRRCNLACKHCHVQAGPGRTENMSRETMAECVRAAGNPEIKTIDITGGAPEMNPDLEWLVAEMAKLQKRLLVRSNLVILLEDGFRHLPAVFAANRVEVVGSLPDYLREGTARQRGMDVFERAIEAIRLLNSLGYGKPGSGLVLDLVHNPVGAYLPGEQKHLEAEYRRVLGEIHGVSFNSLFCLVNCPVGRYLDYLKSSGNLPDYLRSLEVSFNPGSAKRVMCRTTLSVGWDGSLYDCDFNQALGMEITCQGSKNIGDFDHSTLAEREIRLGGHCFACTAGAGSSCQGTLCE